MLSHILQAYGTLTLLAKLLVLDITNVLTSPIESHLSTIYEPLKAVAILDDLLIILDAAIVLTGPAAKLPLVVSRILARLLLPVAQDNLDELVTVALQGQLKCLDLCAKCQVAELLQACSACIVSRLKYLYYAIQLLLEELLEKENSEEQLEVDVEEPKLEG